METAITLSFVAIVVGLAILIPSISSRRRASKKLPPEIDYAAKPLEWFYTEEARASIDKCMGYFGEMQTKADRFYMSLSLSITTSMLTKKDNQAYWPCRFFAYFAAAVADSYAPYYSTVGYKFAQLYAIGKSGRSLKTLDEILSVEKNPVLKFLQKFPDYTDDQMNNAEAMLNIIKVTYLVFNWMYDRDCSDEEWLYNFRECQNSRGERHTPRWLLDQAKKLAAYPDAVPKN